MAGRIARVVVLFATLLTLVSCGRAAQNTSPSLGSGIYGIAVTSPGGMIPAGGPSRSPLPGGFGMSGDVPVPDALLVVKDVSGAVVARIKADAQGVFRLSLPPGTYAVWGDYETGRETAVTVKPGVFTRAICYAFIHY